MPTDRIVLTVCLHDLLQQQLHAVLATADETGLPLATPLSYVYLDGAIYFHGAATGHKLQTLAANPRVCFCVVDDVDAVYDNSLSTYYQSALAHGTATVPRGRPAGSTRASSGGTGSTASDAGAAPAPCRPAPTFPATAAICRRSCTSWSARFTGAI